MNLIDAHVTKVLNKKKYVAPKEWDELAGKEFDIFTVEYWDDGGTDQIKDLWFDADKYIDIQPGYIFQH